MDLVNRLRDELEETRMGHRVVVAAMSEERDLLERAITQLNDSVHRVDAEREAARGEAERWQDDALRLMTERNKALEERDAARRAYCMAAYRLDPKGESTPMSIAHQQGWDCFRKDGGNA